MLKLKRKIINRIMGNWYIPVRTIWPYPEGWCVMKKDRSLILETGLDTKEEAQEICDYANTH